MCVNFPDELASVADLHFAFIRLPRQGLGDSLFASHLLDLKVLDLTC